MKDIDGVYAVATSGPGGSAAGVIQISRRNLAGKDPLGAEYAGTRPGTTVVGFTCFDVMMPPAVSPSGMAPERKHSPVEPSTFEFPAGPSTRVGRT